MSELPPGVRPARAAEPRDSALGVVVRRGDDGGWEVLLGRRSSRSNFMPGHLAFPGGHLEKGDRPGSPGALERCATREVAEETGVEIPVERWLSADARITPPIFPVRFNARFFVAVMPDEQSVPSEPPSPREIESLGFYRPSEIVGRWSEGGALVPPPVLPLLRAMSDHEGGDPAELADVLAGANRIEQVRPRIEFVPGIWMLPVASLTLPPATHTNAWMPGARRFVIFDPGCGESAEIDRLLSVARRREVEEGSSPFAVVLTHHHGDHVAGAAPVARALGVPVRAHRDTLERVDLEGVPVEPLSEDDVIDLDGMTLEARHTPGHAPGHLAFRIPEKRALIAGDLISGMSTILIDPDEGDMGAYLDSLRRVSALDCRSVLPAHGPPLPAKSLHRLLRHREERETRVLEAMVGGAADLEEIARAAYTDVPDMPPALTSRQALSHLLDLERRGKARRSDAAGRRWSP